MIIIFGVLIFLASLALIDFVFLFQDILKLEKAAKGQGDGEHSDVTRLKQDLEFKVNELSAKEQEIRRITSDLTRLQNQQKSVMLEAESASAKDNEIKRLTIELAHMTDQAKEIAKVKTDLSAALSETQDYKNKVEQIRLEYDKIKAELTKKIAEGSTANTASQEYEKNIQQLNAEAKKFKSELDSKINELILAQTDAQENKKKLVQVQADYDKLKVDLNLKITEGTAAQATSEASQENLRQLHNELKKLKNDLELKTTELADKDIEVKTVAAELAKIQYQQKNAVKSSQDLTEGLSKLKKTADELDLIEKSLDEEKKALYEMKTRFQEGKMKLGLLSEKSKESVELIAQFAEGKEFEEFRKSIHMDEIINKYEGEIKSLKLKVLDLEKKV
ncbi:MAG: hypothetical protein HQL26_00465 [Candidatus Omnitrophica bacterium]|nr:hypothetical protein [Candidatus Omnitrophota bacterium]